MFLFNVYWEINNGEDGTMIFLQISLYRYGTAMNCG